MNQARLMPRPVRKEYTDESITIEHNFLASSNEYDFALRHYITVPRNLVCESTVVGTEMVPEMVIPGKPATSTVVIPATEKPIVKWNCVPLLSDEEEAAIDGVTL